MDRPHDDLEQHDNVTNQLECQEKCRLLSDCNVWTFVSGICYMKNENTFKGSGDNVISGTKECNHSGNNVFMKHVYNAIYYVAYSPG